MYGLLFRAKNEHVVDGSLSITQTLTNDEKSVSKRVTNVRHFYGSVCFMTTSSGCYRKTVRR